MSEIIVLDTHIWIWAVNGNSERMPATWLDRIKKADRVGISPVSCYEVALANKKGRLELSSEVEEWFKVAAAPHLFELKYSRTTKTGRDTPRLFALSTRIKQNLNIPFFITMMRRN